MVIVNAHGIQGDAARWIRNWLVGRRQRVRINQSYSNWAPVTLLLLLLKEVGNARLGESD